VDDPKTKAPERKKQKIEKEKVDSIGGLTFEYAKSGRSTCRKCGDNIDKGAPRVGMEAWIAGRQATTWQCIICALRRISIGYDMTGRSKCCATGDLITKGEVKMAVRSHTATRYYKLSVIKDVLPAILAWGPPEKMKQAKSLLSLEGIDGAQELKPDDRQRLDSILSNLEAPSSSRRGDIADEVDQAEDEEMKTKTSHDPPKLGAVGVDGKPLEGKVAHKEGEVEWKWGGGKFKGTLLPNQETESQCFAKTHNGNVKTLNKGKEYWSVV